MTTLSWHAKFHTFMIKSLAFITSIYVYIWHLHCFSLMSDFSFVKPSMKLLSARLVAVYLMSKFLEKYINSPSAEHETHGNAHVKNAVYDVLHIICNLYLLLTVMVIVALYNHCGHRSPNWSSLLVIPKLIMVSSGKFMIAFQNPGFSSQSLDWLPADSVAVTWSNKQRQMHIFKELNHISIFPPRYFLLLVTATSCL